MKLWRRSGGDSSRRARPERRPLPANPLFPALLGLWGFALGGLVTLVLPSDLVLAAAARTGLGALGATAPVALAGLAAMVLGLALYLAARALARKVKRRGKAPSIATMAMRHVRTIDPARELGSGSLDEPLETVPFAPAKPDSGTDAAPGHAAIGEDLPPPRSLALEEFAAMPGRDAVWVEEPAPVESDETITPAATPAAPDPAPVAAGPVAPRAVARLRAVPPSELSLVQMVERFAAALHERQAASAGEGRPADAAGRDAALAEALKALATLAGEDRAEGESEPLREALARLQELRGAA